MKTPLSRLLLTFSWLILGTISTFADDTYNALAEALDEGVAAAEKLENIQANISTLENELKALTKARAEQEERLGEAELPPAYHAKKKELAKLRATETTARQEVQKASAKVEFARAAYREKHKWQRELHTKALAAITNIRANGPRNEVNQQRAIAAIMRDLPMVNSTHINDLADFYKAAADMVKAGKPASFIKDALTKKAGNDKALQEVAKSVLSIFEEGLVLAADANLPKSEILEKVGQHAGHLGTMIKFLSLTQGKSSGDPFNNEEIERLIGVLDLSESLLPKQLQLFSGYFKTQKLMVDSIHNGLKDIYKLESFKNLERLQIIGTSPTRRQGTAWGLAHEGHFGHVEAEPKLEGTKETYFPGLTVKFKFEASHRWFDERGWIGLVPSHIPHGSSDLADKHDLSYHYLIKEYGAHSFTAPEEPGRYDIRLFDSDPHISGDGREVASVSFIVSKLPSASLTTDKSEYQPKEQILAKVDAPGATQRRLVLRLLKDNTPDNFEDNILFDRQIKGKSVRKDGESTTGFQAPAEPGIYELRLTDAEYINPTTTLQRTIASVMIKVAPNEELAAETPAGTKPAENTPIKKGDILGEWILDNNGDIKVDNWMPHKGMVIKFSEENGKIVGHVVQSNPHYKDYGCIKDDVIFREGKISYYTSGPWLSQTSGLSLNYQYGRQDQPRSWQKSAITISRSTGHLKIYTFWTYNFRRK